MLTPDSIRGVVGIKQLNEPLPYKIFFTGIKDGYQDRPGKFEIGVNQSHPLFKILDSMKDRSDEETKKTILIELAKLGFREINLDSIKKEDLRAIGHSVEAELNIATSNLKKVVN